MTQVLFAVMVVVLRDIGWRLRTSSCMWAPRASGASGAPGYLGEDKEVALSVKLFFLLAKARVIKEGRLL